MLLLFFVQMYRTVLPNFFTVVAVVSTVAIDAVHLLSLLLLLFIANLTYTRTAILTSIICTFFRFFPRCQPAFIRAISSGNKRIGIIHKLFVQDVEIQEYVEK